MWSLFLFGELKRLNPWSEAPTFFDLLVIRCFAGTIALYGFHFAIFLVNEVEFYLPLSLLAVRCSTSRPCLADRRSPPGLRRSPQTRS